jgi:hypothetical protein
MVIGNGREQMTLNGSPQVPISFARERERSQGL